MLKKINWKQTLIFMGLTSLPLLWAMIICIFQGGRLWDIYLPNSQWNDEVIYYKQVEAVLEYGFPQGYFGYNEGTALKGSFGAWNPVIMLPWIIWGSLFGWNLLSPIFCNIALLVVAFGIYTILTKPDPVQALLSSLFFTCMFPFVRYELSGSVESIFFSFSIVVLSIHIANLKTYNVRGIIAGIVIAFIMTLMRPYYFLYFLFPSYCIYKRKKWRGMLIGAGCSIVSVAGSLFVSKVFCAQYFEPLIKVEYFEPLLQGNIIGAVEKCFERLCSSLVKYYTHITNSFSTGNFAGKILLIFGVSILVLGVELICKKIKGDKGEHRQTDIILLLCQGGMFIAITMLYTVYEGSRHLIPFILLVGFWWSIKRKKWHVIFYALFCMWLFLIHINVNPVEYQIPFRQDSVVQQMEEIEKELSHQMKISGDDISFENTIDWILSDEKEGEIHLIKYQYLYTVPAGFGINICGRQIFEDLSKVKAKYVMTLTDGEVYNKLLSEGAICIIQNEEVAFFNRYNF